MVEIYGLYDPDTDELRYVGKAKNSAKRLKTHLFDRHLNRPVCRWVKALVDAGKCPVMRVLETVEDKDWEQAERRLIAEHRKSKRLLNLADGGAIPSQTKEQRRKAAKASNAAQANKSQAWKNLQRAKMHMGRLLTKFMKDGDYSLAYVLRFRMKLDAANKPHLYGSWANL